MNSHRILLFVTFLAATVILAAADIGCSRRTRTADEIEWSKLTQHEQATSSPPPGYVRPTVESQFAKDLRALDGEVQIHLDFSGSGITDDDLLSLAFPDNVRGISLRGTAVTNRGVVALRRASNLEILDLHDTQITAEVLHELVKIPRLWNADVTAPNVSVESQIWFTDMLRARKADIPYAKPKFRHSPHNRSPFRRQP